MHKNFFDAVNIPPESINIPNGMESDAAKECARYDEVIRSLGGIDLQLLGLAITATSALTSLGKRLKRRRTVSRLPKHHRSEQTLFRA